MWMWGRVIGRYYYGIKAFMKAWKEARESNDSGKSN